MLECSMRLLHGFVMTMVGENDIALRLRQTRSSDEHFAKVVEAEGVLGT